MTAVRVGILAGLVLAVPFGPARAHPIAPALLEITESGGRLDIVWKVSVFGVPGVVLRPVLPPDCRATAAPNEEQGIDSITARWTAVCASGALVGRDIAVDGLAAGKTDALVRVALADGRLVRAVLRPGAPQFTVPARDRPRDVLRSYATLGLEHILTGPDHLLFVLGLLLLVGAGSALVRTITAFTLGHSVTLSLAALGLATVPSRPIEVGIAASVFLLAVELTRLPGPRPTLMRRAPWLMAGVFGLLHGLGFAGALAEVGLPPGEIPVALFSFNVGIELGQLCFVVGALVVAWGVGRLVERRPPWLGWVPLYGMGSLSALWCIERTAALVLGP